MNKDKENDHLALLEHQILLNLAHRNIIAVVRSYFSPDKKTFIMVNELCPYGSTRDQIDKRLNEFFAEKRN